MLAIHADDFDRQIDLDGKRTLRYVFGWVLFEHTLHLAVEPFKSGEEQAASCLQSKFQGCKTNRMAVVTMVLLAVLLCIHEHPQSIFQTQVPTYKLFKFVIKRYTLSRVPNLWSLC